MTNPVIEKLKRVWNATDDSFAANALIEAIEEIERLQAEIARLTEHRHKLVRDPFSGISRCECGFSDAPSAEPSEPKHQQDFVCEGCQRRYLVISSAPATLLHMDCKCGHRTALNRT